VGTKTVQVTVNPLPVVIPGSNSPVCAGNTLSLTVGAAASYSWSGPNAFGSALQNPTIPNVTPAASGNYTVVLTTASGCTASAVISVSILAVPIATAGNNSPVCPGATFTLTSGTGISYVWNGPNGYGSPFQNPVVPNATTLSAGIYTVVVTGAGGCTASATTSVTIFPLPTPTATSNSPVCLGKPINLFGLGGTTYTWSGPGGFGSNAQNPVIAVAQASNAGVYTLVVTNNNGCVGTATTNVVVNPLPVIVVNNPTVCVGQNINLTATGGTAYAWSGPLGYSSPLQNPVIGNAQVNMSGNYTVIVTSAFGCTNSAVANVSVIALPVPAITSNTPCVGGTLTLFGSGGGSYNWNGPNAFGSGVQNPVINNVPQAAGGIYTLVVTVGACSNSITALVVINPLPTPTATSNSPVCLGKPINLFGLGGTTYTWSGPGGFGSNAQNPVIAIAQASNAGVYTLSVTNANGCVNFTTTTVVVNPLPVIVVNNPTVCVGQNINLTATGGTAYVWSGPLGYGSPLQNPVIVNAQVNMSGNYTVIVTSAFGCTNSAVANVSVIALPVPAITSNTPCVGGTLTLFGSGGGGYAWNGPNAFGSGFQNPIINNVPQAAGGIYTLVVTVGACSNSITALVTINPLPTPTATSNSPVCVGQPINLFGSGGTTYTWSGPGAFGSNAQNPVIAIAQASNAGVYTLSVTNANGCVNFTTTTVVINPLPVIVVNNPTVCLNQNINLTATGGTAYAWSGPLGYSSPLQNPVIPLAQLNMSGGYTVTVTSAFGCTNTAVANVSVITLPNPIILSNSPVCVGATLSFTGSGGAAYNWSGPNGFASLLQNPNIVNVQMAANGIYTLIATAGTCSNVITASVVINPLPVPTATSNSPVCVGQPVNFTGAGGTTYTWSGPGAFASNAQNPVIAIAQASNAGTYTLTVTNANGCTNSITTNVIVNPLPVIVVNNPTVCVNQNINLTATGGTAYVWSGPLGYSSPLQNPVIPLAQVNMSGGYTVTVTSAFGCTNTAVANVSVITLPVAGITSNTPCVGGTLTLFGSGGGTYSWNGPNAFGSGFQNPTINNVQLVAGGIYTLVVTVGTCSNITTAPVVINPLPVPTATSNSPVCVGQPVNFTGAGGTTYTWSGPGAFASNAQNPVIAIAQTTNAGTYTLTVTNANGCTNSITTNVIINPLPVIVVNNPTVCLNQNINLTATGGTAYAWSGPLGYSSPLQNPVIPLAQLNMSGGYTVTVTSGFGCTNTAVANVTVITLPNPAIVSNTPCVGATLTFSGSGGATYSWNGPNGFASLLQNPTIPNVQMAANGIYTLVVTAGTCSNVVTAPVTINPLPVPTATSNSPVCVNQPINFTGAGGTTYTWSGPGAFLSNISNPVIAIAQTSNAGVYTLTVTNVNGCTNTITTNVIVNTLPVIAVNNPTVCVNQNIPLTSNGGTAYAWSGQLGYTSPIQNPIIPLAQVNMSGNYTVTVTSAFGCTNTAVANVSVVALPVPAITSNTPCVGGILNLTGSGGVLYSWSGPNGFASPIQNPNLGNVQMAANGTYSLVVTVGACSNIITAPVTINPLPTPTATSNSPVCVDQPINFTGAGGVSYSWSGPGAFASALQNPTIAIASFTNGGNYILTVTNANGCTNSITTNVVINPLPVVSAAGSTVCLNTPATLTSGGANTYAWSGPAGYSSPLQNPVIPNAQLNMSGTYTVTGTSAQGCTNTAVAYINILALPNPVIVTNTPCIGNTLNFNGSGGMTYSWSGPNGFNSSFQNPNIPNTTMATAGTYSLMTTIGTCSAVTSAVITINPLPTPNIMTNSPVCLQDAITFFASGGNLYAWVGPNNYSGSGSNIVIQPANNNNAGTYTVTVTDANSCVNTTTASVSINPLPVIATLGSTLCAAKTMSLSASSVGASSYAWTGPNAFNFASASAQIPNATLAMDGQYSVTVTDGNGCSSTSVANVRINALPNLTVSANTPICANQTINLGAGAPSGLSYVWTAPNGMPVIQQNIQIKNATQENAGTYTVMTTDNIGCSAQATVNMEVRSLPVVTISSDKAGGCVPVCMSFNSQSTSSLVSGFWQFGDGSSISGLNVNKCFTYAGHFDIRSKFTDVYGCSNTSTFTIEGFPIPVADFNYASAKPIINETVEFTDASHEANVTGWTWNFSHLKNEIKQKPQLSLSYETAGEYVIALIVTSDKGCRDTAVKSITIGDDFGIFVPDAFTPNGDGLNDVFQPKAFGVVKYELNVFDRWGERLFTTTEFTQGWNGTFVRRGEELVKEDVYIWSIKVTTVFGKSKEISGKVTLIR
jgi:gliding motility-associated-like protein